MMPQQPQEIINQAIKYLYLSKTKLSSADSHVVLAPSLEWSKTGHILGQAIAQLNFANNSVLFLSEEQNLPAPIIVPDVNTNVFLPISTTLSNNVRVDNSAINKLLNSVPDVAIGTEDLYSNTTAPFIAMPMVIESARIRKRGTPFCTPILYDNQCNKTKLVNTLASLVINEGVGIVIADQNLNYEIDSEITNKFYKDITLSLLPELFPILFDESINLSLLSLLAHKFNSELQVIAEGKYINDNSLNEALAVGFSKKKTYETFPLHSIKTRHIIWQNVINAVKGIESTKLNIVGGALITVSDSSNNEIYNRLVLDDNKDIGEAIWEASKDIFEEISQIENVFVSISCLVNQEPLVNPKSFNKSDPQNYKILVQVDNHGIEVDIEDTVAKTVQRYGLDVASSFLHKPYEISLPIEIILMLHDLGYGDEG